MFERLYTKIFDEYFAAGTSSAEGALETYPTPAWHKFGLDRGNAEHLPLLQILDKFFLDAMSDFVRDRHTAQERLYRVDDRLSEMFLPFRREVFGEFGVGSFKHLLAVIGQFTYDMRPVTEGTQRTLCNLLPDLQSIIRREFDPYIDSGLTYEETLPLFEMSQLFKFLLDSHNVGRFGDFLRTVYEGLA